MKSMTDLIRWLYPNATDLKIDSVELDDDEMTVIASMRMPISPELVTIEFSKELKD